MQAHEIVVTGDRREIIEWLSENIGEFCRHWNMWVSHGIGWHISPYGINYHSIFEEPKIFVIKIWDDDKALLTRLRWA